MIGQVERFAWDMLDFDSAPEVALQWHQEGHGVVLATVVQTWGSAPRRVGAQMVIREDGQMQGSVSGGCIEGAVFSEALEIMKTNSIRLLKYGVTDENAFEVGLACGGTIEVLLEPVGEMLKEAVLNELVKAREARQKVAYIVDLQSSRSWLEFEGHEARFTKDLSGVEPDGRHFVQIYNPSLRLAIVGGVHIAQTLSVMATMAGFDVTIIDPRSAFANAERFPNQRLMQEWPDEALNKFHIDARTALVLLTHDTKLDDPALQVGLNSDAFYIGALGSKKTHAKRLERLQSAGFDTASCARIHGPIGLNIGAANPQEIAVSIMAEIVKNMRVGR